MWLNVIKLKLKSSPCWSEVLADHVPLFDTKLQMTRARSGRSCNTPFPLVDFVFPMQILKFFTNPGLA